MKYNACLKLVPDSLPFITESPTIQTITPPVLITLYNSTAIFSKSNEYYFLGWKKYDDY